MVAISMAVRLLPRGGDCPQGGDMYDAPAQGSLFEGSRAQPLPEALISAPQAKKFWR